MLHYKFPGVTIMSEADSIDEKFFLSSKEESTLLLIKDSFYLFEDYKAIANYRKMKIID